MSAMSPPSVRTNAATFAAAWATGRVMMLDQTIAEALNATSFDAAHSHQSTPIP
jgi:hypothetical protein